MIQSSLASAVQIFNIIEISKMGIYSHPNQEPGYSFCSGTEAAF